MFDTLHCKECAKIYSAKRRAENPELDRIAHAKWYAENKEKAKGIVRKWQSTHPKNVKAAINKWRKANPEKHCIFSSKWRAAHPWANRIYKQNRRARMIGGVLSSGLAEKLFKLQRGKCACCGESLGKDHHLDHVIPIALGGANGLEHAITKEAV